MDIVDTGKVGDMVIVHMNGGSWVMGELYRELNMKSGVVVLVRETVCVGNGQVPKSALEQYAIPCHIIASVVKLSLEPEMEELYYSRKWL